MSDLVNPEKTIVHEMGTDHSLLLINQAPHSMDTTLRQYSNFRKEYILQFFEAMPRRRHDNPLITIWKTTRLIF